MSLQPGGGNVGIGTANPGERLTIGVGGKIRLEDPLGYPNRIWGDSWASNYRSGLIAETAGSMSFGLTGPSVSGPWAFRWLYNDDASIDYSSDSSELMRLTRNGNLGIGTTNPGAKLQVFGDIMFGGDRGDLQLWEAIATNAGNFCDVQCGNGFCLGAYVEATSTKQSCSTTSNNRQCICSGKP